MSGVLYLIATPIGNLEDISLRALRLLKAVSLVAAEDTRRTRGLLTHFGIGTPLLSVRQHNERRQAAALVDRLRAGESVALVTDAGTPLVSDPGATLVAEAKKAEIRVEAVPGASAVLAALASSGLADRETGGFLFLGFLPNRASDRFRCLQEILASARPVVFFESPHRIKETLAAWGRIGGDRRIAICRELTKLHEDIRVVMSSGAVEQLGSPRGEYTLVVEGRAHEDHILPPLDETRVREEFGQMTETAPSRRTAVAALAQKYGRSQREIYRLVTDR